MDYVLLLLFVVFIDPAPIHALASTLDLVFGLIGFSLGLTLTSLLLFTYIFPLFPWSQS